jgi:hypothetical protein
MRYAGLPDALATPLAHPRTRERISRGSAHHRFARISIAGAGPGVLSDLPQGAVQIPTARLLLLVRLSRERTRQAVRQDCSLPRSRSLPPRSSSSSTPPTSGVSRIAPGHRDTSPGGSCGTPGAGSFGKGARTRGKCPQGVPLTALRPGAPLTTWSRSALNRFLRRVAGCASGAVPGRRGGSIAAMRAWRGSTRTSPPRASRSRSRRVRLATTATSAARR